MRRSSFYYLALLAAAGCRAPQLFGPPHAGQPPQPAAGTFQDVGTLGAWTAARGLNDAGAVVGSSSGSQYGDYPILSQNGAVQRLEMFANVADGAMSGRAGAINTHGTIAGATGTSGLWFVTLWDSTGARTAQTAIGNGRATWADVVAANGDGAVLAWWQMAPDRTQGVVVTNGSVQTLGQLSAIAWTEPAALNRAGHAVGRGAWTYIAPSDTIPDAPTDTVAEWIVHHPFVWDGAMHDLGVFGRTTGCTRTRRCANGAALAINDAGDVVGWSEDSALVPRPFLWRGGALRDLGVFPGKPAYARAINASGVIAGDGNGEAFTWTNGTVKTLGSLGGGYTEVTALNDAGDVAGTALTPSGEQHAFVWTQGRMIDLGVGLGGACAAKATAINSRGDVLIAVMRECFKRLEDPRLTDFSLVRPQLALVWHRQ